MRIAQLAPLYESVPPKCYGGTERVVAYLTDALVELGHEVILYASGDSLTKATLKPICPRALRLDKRCIDSLAHHLLLTEKVFQEAAGFEVIHSHIDYLAFPWLRRCRTPHLTTLHGRLDIPDLRPVYREFSDEPVISISNHQRIPLASAHWQATVYHGLPQDLYAPRIKPGKYLAFLGRISPEKRVDRAIRIARRAGLPLKIAAKVDKVDQAYFDVEIRPLLAGREVEFVGEIGETAKQEFLGDAMALLFPIDWPEPFGLVMIEALACGTPVIAYARGSVPEIIEHGVTGFVVKDEAQAAQAAGAVSQISRTHCRQVFEQRFSAIRMARRYVAIYEGLMAEEEIGARAPNREVLL